MRVMVGIADWIIFASYMLIPLMLAYQLKRTNGQVIRSRRVIGWAIAFIASCGLTHGVGASMVFWPAWRFDILVLWVCAIISLISAAVIMSEVPLPGFNEVPNERK